MESANRESTNRESVKREDTFAEVCSRKFTYQGYTYATLTLALTKIFEAKDRSAWKICNICCNALVSQSGENQNLLQEQMLRFSINYRPIHVHTRAITTSRKYNADTLDLDEHHSHRAPSLYKNVSVLHAAGLYQCFAATGSYMTGTLLPMYSITSCTYKKPSWCRDGRLMAPNQSLGGQGHRMKLCIGWQGQMSSVLSYRILS
jgi:hypothetical protein